MAYDNNYDLSLDAALKILASGEHQVLAGGTDYYPGLLDTAPAPDLLGVHRIAGMNEIALMGNVWRFGAAVTWSKVIQTNLPSGFNCLKQAGAEVGSIQIQNAASLVGNVCNASPAADGVPALLALDAQVELSSVDGVRVLPLTDFITGVRKIDRRANELVTALLIPDANAHDESAFTKLGSRTYLVISIVMCASRFRVNKQNTITDAAIAVGACSPVACRLPEIEKVLVGRQCTPSELGDVVTTEQLNALSPITDVRATAEYRLNATRVLLQRQLLSLARKFSDESESGVSS